MRQTLALPPLLILLLALLLAPGVGASLTTLPLPDQAAHAAGAGPASGQAVSAAPGIWETVWRGTGELAALTCVGAGHCFGAGDLGMFLRSSDGGRTWHYESVDPGHDLKALAFSDPDHGLLVGEMGAVYRTASGGRTWEAAAVPGGAGLHAISLLGDGQAWAAGEGGSIF